MRYPTLVPFLATFGAIFCHAFAFPVPEPSIQRRWRGWALQFSSENNHQIDNDNSNSMTLLSIPEATKILQDWDRLYNPDNADFASTSMEDLLPQLAPSVVSLSHAAAVERNSDSTQGRCMLGICASSAAEGVQTLKSWVTTLQLPRGLLHGMDKDGVPIELNGPVYIKYNSGGVYTFADIRKSGLGFDALWKPGDAMLEPYDDGTYRGVYFQVELSDGEFRQFLMPLDLFLMEED